MNRAHLTATASARWAAALSPVRLRDISLPWLVTYRLRPAT